MSTLIRLGIDSDVPIRLDVNLQALDSILDLILNFLYYIQWI